MIELTFYDVPANIYLFKVNTRSQRRLNVCILTSGYNSHHFRVTVADFKGENIYLDSLFWIWNCIYLHRFFSNNKALLSSTRTKIISIGMFQKKQYFVTFRVFYLTKNLACLGEYLRHLNVADMPILFCSHFVITWSRAMTRLPRSNSASLERQLCECLCTNLN